MECAFCGKLERKVRFEPLSKVKEQIRQLEEGFDAIYFLDDVFTLDGERMDKILRYSKLPKRVTTRADMINYAKIKSMAKHNVQMLSMGIESGDDEILKKSSKGITTHEVRRAIGTASECGIATKGFFIIGLPGETASTAYKTINFSLELRELGMETADFYYLTPFPGTPIWNNPEKFGITITDKDYTKYLVAGKGAKCYVRTEKLSSEHIEDLVEEARMRWKN